MTCDSKTTKKIILETIESEINKGNFYKSSCDLYIDTFSDYIIRIEKLNITITLSTWGLLFGTSINVVCDNKHLCNFNIFSKKYCNIMERIISNDIMKEYCEKISELEKFTRGY